MNPIKKSPQTPKNMSKPFMKRINSQMSTTSFTTIDSMDSPQRSYFKGLNSSQKIGYSPKIPNSQIPDASISPINYKRCQNTQNPSRNNNEQSRISPLNKNIETFNQLGCEISAFMKTENSELSTQPGLSQKTFSQCAFQEIAEQNEDVFVNDEDEEEHCIWQDPQLEEMGVDTDNFLNKNGDPLTFYQLYRLRSNAYQPEYVSRLVTMKEVKIISTHYRKGIRMSVLKSQQEQLDQQFTGQTRPILQQVQQQKQLSSPRSLLQLNTKNINSTSLNVSANQKIAKKQYQDQKQKQKSNEKQQCCKSPTQNDLQVFKNYQIAAINKNILQRKTDSSQNQDVSKQTTNIINNNKIHNKREKLLISPAIQEQNQKTTESKIIPVKTITLNNLQNFKADSSLEEFLLSIEDIKNIDKPVNQISDLKIQKESSIILDQGDYLVPNSDRFESSITQTSDSVLKYLKQITSGIQRTPSRQRERFNQQNLSYNQVSKNMRSCGQQQQQLQKLNKINTTQENIKTVKINISNIESKQNKINEENKNQPINFDLTNIYSQLAISKQHYKLDSYLDIQIAK